MMVSLLSILMAASSPLLLGPTEEDTRVLTLRLFINLEKHMQVSMEWEVFDNGTAEGRDAVFGHANEDGPNYRNARGFRTLIHLP